MKQTFLTISLLLTIAAHGSDFVPWSENVFLHVRMEYGVMAEKRVRHLHTILVENQGLPVMEKLELVNRTMNNLPWIADAAHWKKADYWATPLETIATFGGDCEDIAIAKWVMLSQLGVPVRHLRLAFAKLRQSGESHMVIVYLDSPDNPPGKQQGLVLDNLTDDITPASKRRDLLAIYSTDAQGNLTLYRDTGSERRVVGTYSERRTKNLAEIRERIRTTREKYRQINDGRPLLPAPEN